jgi:hypothetical protein
MGCGAATRASGAGAARTKGSKARSTEAYACRIATADVGSLDFGVARLLFADLERPEDVLCPSWRQLLSKGKRDEQ